MPGPSELTRKLDEFLPRFDVIERHTVGVHAPADVTFRAACEINLEQLWLVSAIIRARELLLGGDPSQRAPSKGFLEYMKVLGWGVLSETPNREIVMGALTQPWLANPVFRPLAPLAFATSQETGSVKIAWGVRAESSNGGSILSTETRAMATDRASRIKFRFYWWRVRPGVRLIRWALLRAMRKNAERAARYSQPPPSAR